MGRACENPTPGTVSWKLIFLIFDLSFHGEELSSRWTEIYTARARVLFIYSLVVFIVRRPTTLSPGRPDLFMFFSRRFFGAISLRSPPPSRRRSRSVAGTKINNNVTSPHIPIGVIDASAYRVFFTPSLLFILPPEDVSSINYRVPKFV